MSAASAVAAAAGGGVELHRRLGPETWCVTRRDLHELRRDVRRAIAEGRIVATEVDNFDPHDRFGPSIYTVNEQFIKPVTAAAGNMSWALMRNPTGLKCDLFVTHAWQEGIFEFLDKVLASWPITTRHAWCCMLANPQNLDISDLIKDPLSSPFALAMRSAHYVLVVPNRKGSIYTRLWCVYEAFLAYESGKVILTASDPICRKPFFRAMLLMLICICAGALLSWLQTDELRHWDESSLLPDLTYLLQWCLVLASGFSSSCWRTCWNCLGAVITAHRCGLLVGPCLTGELALEASDAWGYFARQVVARGVFIVFFVVAEADRVRSWGAEVEAKELRAGYGGSVWAAKCADASDARRLRNEIQHCVGSVNAAIQVLMDAGMSTPRLRRAALLGVDVTGAAHREIAFTLHFLCLAISSSIAMLDSRDPEHVGMGAALLGLSLAWVVVFIWLPVDGKAFALLVVGRLCLIFDTPLYLAMRVLLMSGVGMLERENLGDDSFVQVEPRAYHAVLCSYQLVVWCFIIALSMAQVDGVASIPRCGQALAQLLVAHGWRKCLASCLPAGKELGLDGKAVEAAEALGAGPCGEEEEKGTRSPRRCGAGRSPGAEAGRGEGAELPAEAGAEML